MQRIQAGYLPKCAKTCHSNLNYSRLARKIISNIDSNSNKQIISFTPESKHYKYSNVCVKSFAECNFPRPNWENKHSTEVVGCGRAQFTVRISLTLTKLLLVLC